MVDKMANKGPIYREKGTATNCDLLKQLYAAVAILEENMYADSEIYNGVHTAGWGVKKLNRSIAADSVISIARAIKALKGW